MTDKKISPETAQQMMRQIAESMFGPKKWEEMYVTADQHMQDLLGIGITSKRDKMIFSFALYKGITYGVAYSRALRQAQKPLNMIKSFFTRRVRK